MTTVYHLEELRTRARPAAVALGTFDGVHRGHQAVIAAAVGAARGWEGEAWALTFDPHPMKVLRPAQAPPLLTSTNHKLRLLRELGLDGVVVLDFSPALAGLPPGQFLETLAANWPAVRTWVVGRNWRFGSGASGDVDLLGRFVAGRGGELLVVEPVVWEGKPISSTRIREAVQSGRLAEAEAMLGRPYSLEGTVMAGRRYGTRLGFPTANVDPHNEALPPSGVYAVRAVLREGVWKGAAFLNRPADGGEPTFVEVHLLDYPGGELYGREMEVRFVCYLRPVEQFDSPEALRRQIARDVETVRAMAL